MNSPEGFNPKPEDKEFLDNLGKESEKALSEFDGLSSNEVAKLIREHNNPDMINNVKRALASGDCRPDLERLLRSFFEQIGEEE